MPAGNRPLPDGQSCFRVIPCDPYHRGRGTWHLPRSEKSTIEAQHTNREKLARTHLGTTVTLRGSLSRRPQMVLSFPKLISKIEGMEIVQPGTEAIATNVGFLVGLVRARDDFARLLASLRFGQSVVADEAAGSGSALLVASLVAACPGVVLVVAPDEQLADAILEDLKLFGIDEVVLFPALTSPTEAPRPDDETLGQRLRILLRLVRAEFPRVIVASGESLLQAVPPVHVLKERLWTLKAGENLDVAAFLRAIGEHGYRSVPTVAMPGEFSLRGGILDVFAPEWTAPLRIELFDERIESLRHFDVSSQRSVERVEEITLSLCALTEQPAGSLLDYLPPETWTVWIDPQGIESSSRSYLARLEKTAFHHTWETVVRDSQKFARLEIWDIAPEAESDVFHGQMESVERFSGDVERVRDELDAVAGDSRVYLVCTASAEIERLRELFASTQIASSGNLHFVVGRLSRGFRLRPEKIVLISVNQLFQRTELRIPARRPESRPIEDFLDLKEGDLVVHVAHGIARYRGLKLLQKGDQLEEHLLLEFAEGTKLYVPTSKIGLVQKYIGGARARPKLSKLGGRTWTRQKQAVAAAVFDLAAEMLEMQAIRQTRPGIAFPPDTIWQQEFDASFPFEETPDQLEAMAAIKRDMMSPRPMDRLLCGDVGFGKTELAMRAAFKAVDAGYQVAMLVPTTILAEQHVRTFRERMAEFPIRIECLSRFCTPREETEILQGLAEGAIDIVIGTHRLVQPDVRFHNLGLVIIDEEQRFGVEIKERLKSFRQTVDVLTMTATPIPRTLHMALVGLRDISTLRTPPQDRFAVETHVCRFDPHLIRQAVLRELNRHGQIYFVHNRVKDIDAVYRILCQIVPEARIRVAHAQMPDHQLEEIMLAFVRHEFDLLLTTTIIESGLDIPSANTIFIDMAERFGLADLHQLRGRVGRYKHRAYCYLLIHPHQRLNPNARRRLQAIEEYSELGAGFALAMRDLEIRGAGNILGTEQSGHIAAVGYELYCELLEQAVRRLKKLPPATSIDVDVDLPCQAYLPDSYIPDIRTKIDLYRKLARLTEVAQLTDFAQELRDRFGPLPPPVERLLELHELRIHAHWWRIRNIHQEATFVVFQYVSRRKMENLQKLAKGRLRIVDHESAYLVADDWVGDIDQLLSALKSLLQQRPEDPYNPRA